MPEICILGDDNSSGFHRVGDDPFVRLGVKHHVAHMIGVVAAFAQPLRERRRQLRVDEKAQCQAALTSL